MWTSRQRVAQRVEEEIVEAVGATHSSHPGHVLLWLLRLRLLLRLLRLAIGRARVVRDRIVDLMLLVGLLSALGVGRRQAYDPLAVLPRASDALTRRLADEEAIARTPHVLATGGRVADGRGFGALAALDHVLIAFARYVDHVLADATRDHRTRAVEAVVGRRRLLVSALHDDLVVAHEAPCKAV